MLRRLLTLTSALSLLLLVAMVALWVRSYEVADCWRVRRYRIYECNSIRGLLTLSVETQFSKTTYRFPAPHAEQTNLPAAETWQVEHDSISRLLVGQPLARDTRQFRFVRDQQFPGAISSSLGVGWETGFITSYVQFPDWCLAALFIVLPTAWATATCRRRLRTALGRCSTCGYDLRATPDRCPECGTPARSWKETAK
jgi:hypothetical protein